MKRYMYSTDGIPGEEFDAEDLDAAYRKVAEWANILVWELED